MATVAVRYTGSGEVVERRSHLLRWTTTVDHKDIGILYIVTATVFFLAGGVEALLMRTQLAVPNSTFLGPAQYNAVFTMHGTTMIFLVVMPLLLGFSNYLVPLMIGARDMAFPKLNALSYWLLLFGGILLYFSFLVGTPPDTGWFSDAPLTERPYTLQPTIDYWILGLLATGIGTIATGLNLIVTVVKLRAPGMTAGRMPVFVWMSLVTGFLIIWAIPSLTAAQVMLLFDRYLGTHFFQPVAGGDAILWQHLFWFFGHPEVYIMALPAFGIISEVIPVFSRKPIFGYGFIVGSGIAIAFYSFLVWGHHMLAVGMGQLPDGFFGASSMIIAVPTGVKVFSWLGTMWGGKIRFTTAMLFATAFIAMFTIGGLSGVHFALVPVDWQTTESYYVVAHMHYVLFGGSYFGILAGLYYWFPKMTGRMLDEGLGKVNFVLNFVGFNLTFFPMHILGLMGMPRRVYTYPDLPGWGALNFAETIGAFMLGAAVLVLMWNVFQSLKNGQVAGDNPWNGWTLEWATTSPPPAYNFASLPPILGSRPLWELARAPAGGSPAIGTEHHRRPQGPAALRRTGGFLENLSLPIIGILTFISSEIVFFAALIVTFVEFRLYASGNPGPHSLDVPRTVLFSLALFASSATIVMAERRLERGDQRGFRLWLLATLVLGLVFIGGQITEYMRLLADGVSPASNSFTSAFFTLTGFHGVHVIIGLIALASVALLSFRGDVFAQGRHARGFQAVSYYWHFVDAVWVVVLSTVYLWSLF